MIHLPLCVGEAFFKKPPLRVRRRHAPAARCSYCLPVFSVRHVPGCKYSVSRGERCSRFGPDMPGVLQFHLVSKEPGIRMLTDRLKCAVYFQDLRVSRCFILEQHTGENIIAAEFYNALVPKQLDL